VSLQDWCMACAKHLVGSEILLDTLMVLRGDEVQLEAWFSPFGDSSNLDAR
jgi:hypothetical protein